MISGSIISRLIIVYYKRMDDMLNDNVKLNSIKRSLYVKTPIEDHKMATSDEKITCESTNEMHGTYKVWVDIETGERYFMLRTSTCVFVKIKG